MSTSFQEILDWLDMPFAPEQTHVHGLVSVEDEESVQRQQSPPAVIRALLDAERYHASHVYFRAFPDSEKPPQAQAFLYDCTDKLYHEAEAELAKIQLTIMELWQNCSGLRSLSRMGRHL